ncbi:unnamed protein product [Rotaria sordida]|uniref:Uncharacterized protein n=1 Tax=Rotaria sordida TaxID=392033 RepID=A0A819BK07_9BILA|nr:unnamed protein product [Rotaria sordida]
MGDHLMMCGNKTDQCPNCRQFVRRAIFAYHYENNCANPDVPTRDNEPNQKAQDTTRSQQFNDSNDNAFIPCEYCNQGIQWHLYDNHTKACREEYYKQLQEKTRRSSQQPAPATTTAKCIHCRLLRSLEGLAYHQDSRAEQERERKFVHQDNNNHFGRCKYCNEQHMVDFLGAHEYSRVEQEHERIQQQSRSTYQDHNNLVGRCKHCNDEYMVDSLSDHEEQCNDATQLADQERYVTEMTITLQTPSNRENAILQRSNSEIRETILCPFCNCECDRDNLEAHRRICLENPNKIEKKRPKSFNGSFNQYLNRVHEDDQSLDATQILCKSCKEWIEWQSFEQHTNFCTEQKSKQEQQQQQPLSFIHQYNDNRFGRCKYCNEQYMLYMLSFHETYCSKPGTNLDAKQDPDRRQQQSRSIYNNNRFGRCKYCNAKRSIDLLATHETCSSKQQ